MLKNTVSVLMLALVLLCSVGALSGCGDAATRSMLDRADSLMEAHPDSALSLLDGIDRNALVTRADRARHSLLLSMALDKNYVDTTTFDILQPAIDYYADHGSADERLRTLYYQGRIYQNRGDRNRALTAFTRATESTVPVTDSLTLVRALVARSMIFFDLYDFDLYIDNRLRAAEISGTLGRRNYEFDCLIKALNGAIIIENEKLADSILTLFGRFDELSDYECSKLYGYQFAHIVNFGSVTDIQNYIDSHASTIGNSFGGGLNLARAYNMIGENTKAKSILDEIIHQGHDYDTLKLQAVMVDVLKAKEDYRGALSAYEDYTARMNYIDYAKFDSQLSLLEEQYRIETEANEDARSKRRIIWGCVGGIAFLMMGVIILLLVLRTRKNQQKMAIQKIRLTELENERLYSEIEELQTMLEYAADIPADAKTALRQRLDALNSILVTYITERETNIDKRNTIINDITATASQFMDSNRLAFRTTHPAFIKHLEDHNLSVAEINYVCLYALGLNGKEVGKYLNRPGHKNRSIAIRKKLGIEHRSTNLGNYIRHLLKSS